MKTKLYYLFLAVMWWLLGYEERRNDYESNKE